MTDDLGRVALEQREGVGQRDGDDRLDLVRVEPVRVEGEVGASGEHLLHLVVGPSVAARKAAAEPGQVGQGDVETDLLVRFADRVRERLAGTEMPADGDVERAGPGVLGSGAALEEGERPTVLVDAADPDVQRAVPVAVAVDVASGLDRTRGAAALVQDVEQLVLRIGGGVRAAQNRSSTPSSAPSATSCSVSSLRPGRTSRCMTPSSSSRYCPTQSSRGE